MIYGARVEERCHESMPIKFALELQGFSGLERVPDRAQGQDVLAKARCRSIPGHREAAGYMGLDLRAEPEDEASIGELLEIPGRLGHLHGGPGEGDGDRGTKLYLMGLVCGYGQGQERVVFRLAGPQAGESEVFCYAGGGPVYPSEVIALCAESGVQFHGLVLRDK